MKQDTKQVHVAEIKKDLRQAEELLESFSNFKEILEEKLAKAKKDFAELIEVQNTSFLNKWADRIDGIVEIRKPEEMDEYCGTAADDMLKMYGLVMALHAHAKTQSIILDELCEYKGLAMFPPYLVLTDRIGILSFKEPRLNLGEHFKSKRIEHRPKQYKIDAYIYRGDKRQDFLNISIVKISVGVPRKTETISITARLEFSAADADEKIIVTVSDAKIETDNGTINTQ